MEQQQQQQQQQQINIEQLFMKIGILTWANDNLSQKVTELEKMCSVLEEENKLIKPVEQT